MKKQHYGYIVILILVIFFLLKNFLGSNSARVPNTDGSVYRDTSDLILTRHVACRMECREITLKEIKEILIHGKLNNAKSKIGSQGDQTYALEGYSEDGQNIRVVVAPEKNGLVVITCIDLKKEWPCHCN